MRVADLQHVHVVESLCPIHDENLGRYITGRLVIGEQRDDYMPRAIVESQRIGMIQMDCDCSTSVAPCEP